MSGSPCPITSRAFPRGKVAFAKEMTDEGNDSDWATLESRTQHNDTVSPLLRVEIRP